MVSCNEAFGYTHQQTLDSSFPLLNAMLAEYGYIWRERNRSVDDTGEVEGVDYEWVDLPDWDNPGKTKRLKKFRDMEGHIR